MVVALVDNLDVDVVEKKYHGTRGKPAYSRKMLLRLLLMAYLDGVFSSRKISKLARGECGFTCTLQGWKHLISGLYAISKSNAKL